MSQHESPQNPSEDTVSLNMGLNVNPPDAARGTDEAESIATKRIIDSSDDGYATQDFSSVLKEIESGNSTNGFQSKNTESNRFQIKRPHAKGGLGIVYVANDSQLNRDVALKQIRGDYSENTLHREKFYLEAEITGQLEHPGIVPVYSLGVDSSNSPFYAMRFIEGENFQESIKRFHQSRSQSEKGFSGLEFRQLLRRFVDACNAIDYAHARGVLHRDIKPANVMIGSYGETLVVDWGLAKVFGSESKLKSKSPRGTAKPPVRSYRSGSNSETLIGSFSGTIAYASPEQLRGDLDLLCPESDVYSLGCMLYSILTNQPPVVERMDPITLAKWIHAKKIKSAYEINSGVPKPLSAICQKAMSASIGDRYESARALADDLERWLADERVIAFGRKEPFTEIAGRLMRKYRSWTTSIAISLIVIAGIAAIGSLLVNRARLNERQAKNAAQTYKSEAVDRYSIARDAIDTLLIKSSESLADFPATRDLQQRFLQLAADDYARLSERTSKDPELELERVKALARLADIYHTQAQYEKAHGHYEEALGILHPLTSTADPKNSTILLNAKIEAANIRTRIGQALDIEDKIDDSRSSFSMAISSLRKVLVESPNSELASSRLAIALVQNANLESRVGDPVKAEAMIRESLLIRKRINASPSPKEILATIRTRESLARVLNQRGNYKQSLEVLSDAKEELSAFYKGPLMPSDINSSQYNRSEYGEALASLYISSAKVFRSIGQFDESLADLRAAKDVYVQLSKQWPDNLQFVEWIALSDTDIGLVLLDHGRSKEAHPIFLASEIAYKSLSTSYPTVTRYKEGWATALSGLGQTCMDLTDLQKDSNDAYSSSRELLKELATRAEDAKPYLVKWAVVTSQQAQLLQAMGDNSKAKELFTESTELLQKIVSEFPNEPELRHLLAHVYWRFGLSEFDLDHKEESTKLFDVAISLWSSIAKQDKSAEHVYRVAWCLLRCPEQSVRNTSKALPFAQQCVELAPNNRDYQNILAEALLQNDNRDQAIQILNSIKNQNPSWNANDYCVLAKIQELNGDHPQALESLELAKTWTASNRPSNLDDLRMLKQTENLLSKP